MPDFVSLHLLHNKKPIKVWVLAPQLETGDENLDYYYDFSQSIEEYTKTFSELNLPWKWQPVTINNYAAIITDIISERDHTKCLPVIFNICDGDEINATPGLSVVKLLHAEGLIYTGADEFFYEITTSKINMKRAFDVAKVPTPKWTPIYSQNQDLQEIFRTLGTPVILKPSISGGSMGIGTKNVVTSIVDLKKQVDELFLGYRGWNLLGDGLIAESYICGQEYTALIVGSYFEPELATLYHPVERIFHPSLPDNEQFLSFDRLWEIYEAEAAMPMEENFFEYSLPDPALVEEIKKVSWDAFVSVKGTGYTRVDIRRDRISGKMYVLEVNAQCGISEDENYTSIGAILKFSGKTFTELVKEIIENAILKNKLTQQSAKLNEGS
jgi:D-alanine-D-alanine ligase